MEPILKSHFTQSNGGVKAHFTPGRTKINFMSRSMINITFRHLPGTGKMIIGILILFSITVVDNTIMTRHFS